MLAALATDLQGAAEVKVSPYTPSSSSEVSPGEQLVLYLPFVAVLRTEGVLKTIRALARKATKKEINALPRKGPEVGLSETKSSKISQIFKGDRSPLSNNDVKKVDQRLQGPLYVCKKCRKIVFSQKDLSDHHRNPDPRCTSWFLEELETSLSSQMTSGVSGKLVCPNPSCENRIGEFNWAGIRCSCGKFVSPACQLSKGKVEEKVVRFAATSIYSTPKLKSAGPTTAPRTQTAPEPSDSSN